MIKIDLYKWRHLCFQNSTHSIINFLQTHFQLNLRGSVDKLCEKKHNRFLRIFLADLPENEHQASPLYKPTKSWISAKSFTNICSFLLVTLHNHYSKSFCQPSTIPALLSLSLPSCVYSVNKNVLLLLLMVYKTFSVDSIFREIFDFWFLIFLYLKKHLSKGHLLV
jgi:hypothetical protein